jgi:hypothetical protein
VGGEGGEGTGGGEGGGPSKLMGVFLLDELNLKP